MNLHTNFVAIVLAALTSACAGDTGTPPPKTSNSLTLNASVTLTAQQATQPEQIFLYTFPLPAGQQSLLGLHGTVSMSAPSAGFNEALITVATIPGTCPASGGVYANYAAIYAALPTLQPVQSFILKDPNQGTTTLTVNFQLPATLPVSNCMVLMMDWEGQSAVTMSSTLVMTYTTPSSPSTAVLLSTNNEAVFGLDVGSGSTTNDSLQFVQEALIPQPGTILAFVGDISDSPVPPAPIPPGPWQVTNNIYLVPGGCPSQIPVDAANFTDTAGHYAADIPPTAQLLFTMPLNGVQQMAVTQPVYQQLQVAVNAGDCLLTLFALNAPNGGAMDAETQVQTLFQPGA
ncbi:MAG TPA: hypothetical protein VFA43_20120 [Gemmatimonadaceae bacterium]|nr:hypothetical protein [Gemmatimonadaceae bacterium]